MNILEMVKFKHCPQCGECRLEIRDPKSVKCISCGFVYYHNPGAVAIGIVRHDEKIILTKRASEPGKGLLALPGGFVDYEESLEEALGRELREELNIAVKESRYLCSYWEKYTYREIKYYTIVTFFVVEAENAMEVKINEELSDYLWIDHREIDQSQLAFASDRVALAMYEQNVETRQEL